MEQEQLTLYKLMILYLIEKVDFPLSNSQISEFILDKGYTNYFTVQRAFHELEEENMLRVKQIRNMSHYALSDEGSEAIEMFEYQIPNSIKEDIAQFLKEKEYALAYSRTERIVGLLCRSFNNNLIETHTVMLPRK